MGPFPPIEWLILQFINCVLLVLALGIMTFAITARRIGRLLAVTSLLALGWSVWRSVLNCSVGLVLINHREASAIERLNQGASPNAFTFKPNGEGFGEPLVVCAARRELDFLKVVLRKGADPLPLLLSPDRRAIEAELASYYGSEQVAAVFREASSPQQVLRATGARLLDVAHLILVAIVLLQCRRGASSDDEHPVAGGGERGAGLEAERVRSLTEAVRASRWAATGLSPAPPPGDTGRAFRGLSPPAELQGTSDAASTLRSATGLVGRR